MDEKEILDQIAATSAGIAESSITSSTDLTRKRAKGEWLKEYQFKPGQSGNPGGRKSSREVTNALDWAGGLPCPPDRKKKLEQALGLKLRNDLTMAQYTAIMLWQRAGTDTHTAAWITDRIEGPMKQQLGLDVVGNVNVNGPLELVTQYVQLGDDGLPIRVLTVEGNNVDTSNGDGTTAATAADSLSLPDRIQRP